MKSSEFLAESRSRRRAVAAWLALALLACLAGSRPAAGQSTADSLGSRPLSKVVVEGNKYSDTKLILRTAGLETGRTADAGRMREAVKSLYGLGLFSSVHVRDWPDTNGTRAVAFEVVENPRLATLIWKGNKKLSEEDLKGKIDLKAGQLLTSRKLFEAQHAIEAAYRDEGYASAKVEPKVGDPLDGSVELTFDIQEGKRVSIVAVDFSGNQAFSAKKLRGKMLLRKNSLFHTKRFTTERVREDVDKLEEFYRNNGYKDVNVTARDPVFSADRHEVQLDYDVQEGSLYRFGHVEWAGNKVVSGEALNRATAIVPGQPFSKAKLEATTAAAYELYTEKGYLLQLQIAPETSGEGDTVHVAYSITEGEPSHVHEVTILGNTRTKERVIRREMSLIPGQLMRRSVLMRSQRDVFALGFFEDVSIDYQPVGEGSDVDVSFTVKEKSTGTATAGAAYASDTGLTGFVELGLNDFLGNGQAVSIHLERGSRRETFDLSFTEPWFMSTPTSVGAQVYNTVRDYDLYTEKSQGGGLNIGRPWFFKVPDFTRVYLGYSLEKIRYENLSNLDPISRDVLGASSGISSRVTLSFTRNSTDNPFYPTAGSKTTASFTFAGGLLGGEQNFYRPLLDHRVYFVPFWKPAIMLRNRLEFLAPYQRGGVVPGGETFRLGGTRTDYLRGYTDYDVVPEENVHTLSSGQIVRFPGGSFAYTFTAEYGFPIVNPVHGVLFLDAGNTWNSSRDFSLGDLKKGVGAGVRLEIPMLGPVGFDYAYGIDRGKWMAHFIIGPAF